MVRVNSGEASVKPKAPVESNPEWFKWFQGCQRWWRGCKGFPGWQAQSMLPCFCLAANTNTILFLLQNSVFRHLSLFYSILFATDQENQRYNNGLPLLRQIVVCLYFTRAISYIIYLTVWVFSIYFFAFRNWFLLYFILLSCIWQRLAGNDSLPAAKTNPILTIRLFLRRSLSDL